MSVQFSPIIKGLVLVALLGTAILNTGCIFPATRPSLQTVAPSMKMHYAALSAHPFTIAALYRNGSGHILRVYIEGDGRAWSDWHTPSNDPTPHQSPVLQLVRADPTQTVAYIARPCQYLSGPACNPSVWTMHRFDPSMIEAMNVAINDLERITNTSKVELVGYSGGATIAIGIAAARQDVVSLRTIAGNLDPASVNRLHGVSPMPTAINTVALARKLSDLPQRHFIGSNDKIVPGKVTTAFFNAMPKRSCSRKTIVAGVDHRRGWVRRWQELLTIPPC